MAFGNVGVIKKYFENSPHGREVTMAEMRALTKEDRDELGRLCAAELGMKAVDGGYDYTFGA